MRSELELSEHWRQHLQGLPESSMGTQHVDIILRCGKMIEDVTVFNGRYAQLTDAEFDNDDITSIAIHTTHKEG